MNYDFLPKYLRVYVVQQEYSNYSSVDHATWRFILKISKNFFISNAHSAYLKGLQETGITEDEIPRIEEIDIKLQKYGWRAVCVKGFIPPLVFMDFQSRAILPIAADMRSQEHLTYTPSPDIVHESAGHSPIIIDNDYSDYLKSYGSIARKAIYSKEDIDVYMAIKKLSDLKEDPNSKNIDIKNAEDNLKNAYDSIRYTSEASMLSRMNWWTVEYGLIGTKNDPKIYGAGLLSSVGESENSLSSKVDKIDFSKECMNYDYNITEQQPQLFIINSFKDLQEALKDIESEMTFNKPVEYGLDRALEARAVCTIELDGNLQISGVVSKVLSRVNKISYIQFNGPTQLSHLYRQIPGHGGEYHSDGYGTPIGEIEFLNKSLNKLSAQELEDLGVCKNKNVSLKFTSGVVVNGRVTDLKYIKNVLSIVKFENCKVTLDSKILFDPSWGKFDLICSGKVESVYGGPADINRYIKFMPEMAEGNKSSKKRKIDKSLDELYLAVKNHRKKAEVDVDFLEKIYNQSIKKYSQHWLILFEILEIIIKTDCTLKEKIINHFKKSIPNNSDLYRAIQRGIDILHS